MRIIVKLEWTAGNFISASFTLRVPCLSDSDVIFFSFPSPCNIVLIHRMLGAFAHVSVVKYLLTVAPEGRVNWSLCDAARWPFGVSDCLHEIYYIAVIAKMQFFKISVILCFAVGLLFLFISPANFSQPSLDQFAPN